MTIFAKILHRKIFIENKFQIKYLFLLLREYFLTTPRKLDIPHAVYYSSKNHFLQLNQDHHYFL